MMKIVKKCKFFILFIISGVLLIITSSTLFGKDWRTADRSSVGLAPNPTEVTEALVQIYSARAFNWRGWLAVHTWIATKPANAKEYTVHQVVGWRKWLNRPVLVSKMDLPDRSWFGSKPVIIRELRGHKAEQTIRLIEDAIATYPYSETYHLWPGPNSNTFTAYIGRKVPELALDMPPTAIGKNYMPLLIDVTPSGNGIQFSFFGIFGALFSKVEGIEIDLLGLNFGVALNPPRLRLPFYGIFSLTKAADNENNTNF